MNDITQHYRYQRILVEASQYRVLRQIIESDPKLSPATVQLIAKCFHNYHDDAGFLHGVAHSPRQLAR